MTAPNGATTTSAYDDLGNLLQEVSPDRGTLTFTHDGAGHVLSRTDARGITATFTYDALGRLTQVDYPGTADDVTHTYDTGPGCPFGVGRLCSTTDTSGTTTSAYDAWGNVLTETFTHTGVAFPTTTTTYDAGNRILTQTDPTDHTVTYTRDAVGRITAVDLTFPDGTTHAIASAMTFRADGVRTAAAFGNGLPETRTYDLHGRLTQQGLGGVVPLCVA